MIIGEPITGQEKRGTLTEPAEALARFYRAFNSRDLALMEENWDPSEETAMANPLGGIKRGWLEIREVYRRIFESRAKVRVEFHDYTLTVAGEVFWAIGRERGVAETESATLELAIRTTRVFRRVNGRWRRSITTARSSSRSCLRRIKDRCVEGSERRSSCRSSAFPSAGENPPQCATRSPMASTARWSRQWRFPRVIAFTCIATMSPISAAIPVCACRTS